MGFIIIRLIIQCKHINKTTNMSCTLLAPNDLTRTSTVAGLIMSVTAWWSNIHLTSVCKVSTFNFQLFSTTRMAMYSSLAELITVGTDPTSIYMISPGQFKFELNRHSTRHSGTLTGGRLHHFHCDRACM